MIVVLKIIFVVNVEKIKIHLFSKTRILIEEYTEIEMILDDLFQLLKKNVNR
jgi:hypothetical protein